MNYFDGLKREPWRFDFLDMMRRVERSLGERLSGDGVFAQPRPRIGDSATRRDEVVRLRAEEFAKEVAISFGQEAWMAFPGSTVREITPRWNRPLARSESLARAETPADRAHVVSAFLGLLGPQGPLPYHLTEEAYAFVQNEDASFVHFLDLFNNRFIQLFFRVWADARPIVQADRPEYDRFGAYVTSVVGVGSPAFDTTRARHDGERRATCIPEGVGLFAGLLAPQVKSASRLRQAIRGLLRVESEIDEFIGSWLEFDDRERSILGGRNSTLGTDFLVGAASFSVQDKIRVRLFVADMEQYRRFLPIGDDCDRLVDLLFFYVGDEIDWDVELAVPARCVEPIRLSADSAAGPTGGARLGWTSWLVDDSASKKDGYRADARFQPAERKRREREMARREAEATNPS
ncbi:type VI secretion system baseplate subunit TssG [Methylosinus sp. H3A]|uniref:type VI secretion system baseplate subunit TssG n=1 Tax=Methylosinus sp. H3A TaxID=2785786 RepID=UPI0018C2ABE0|nr:type VI secretion system baseplate subunit TssG [Methylosinus sp. H3A]MBG0809516.1 type VI secretion system baseplate subunit TssG [Methylosinus sp. H3A]